MDPKKAMEILKHVGAAYIGNLEDHAKIQTALAVLESLTHSAVIPAEQKPE